MAKASYEEKVRQWNLRKGARKLKNRSSKDILRIGHWPRRMTVYKSMSNAALQELSKNDDFDADMELRRRDKKRAKKAAKENA